MSALVFQRHWACFKHYLLTLLLDIICYAKARLLLSRFMPTYGYEERWQPHIIILVFHIIITYMSLCYDGNIVLFIVISHCHYHYYGYALPYEVRRHHITLSAYAAAIVCYHTRRSDHAIVAIINTPRHSVVIAAIVVTIYAKPYCCYCLLYCLRLFATAFRYIGALPRQLVVAFNTRYASTMPTTPASLLLLTYIVITYYCSYIRLISLRHISLSFINAAVIIIIVNTPTGFNITLYEACQYILLLHMAAAVRHILCHTYA